MSEKLRISPLKVMKSNAGYYVGRSCVDEDQCEQPYSRESGYYSTKEAAQSALDNNDYFRG